MIQKINIEEVKENPSNPRTIKEGKFKKLVKSIQDFPRMLEIRPIVVDENMIVLGGNMRLKACKAAGLKQVHIIKVDDLTPEQQKEFVIKDNSGFGEWDWKELELNWDLGKLDDWGMEFPRGMIKGQAKNDNFDEPVPETTTIVEGDLIEIGPHRLLCGSSVISDTMEKLMSGEKAKMAFTDPPYNMSFAGTIDKFGNKGKWAGEIMNDKMSDSDFKVFLNDFVVNLAMYVQGAFYITFYRLGIDQIYTALAANNIPVKSLIIWKKNNFNLSNSDYKSQYEPIFYGWIKDHDFYGAKGESDIWEIERTQANKLHPTMKPVELVAKAISNSSQRKDIILDMFLGSGTTMVAAHQLDRVCYGTELDPKYCQVIIDRMIKLDPKLEVKINGVKQVF